MIYYVVGEREPQLLVIYQSIIMQIIICTMLVIRPPTDVMWVELNVCMLALHLTHYGVPMQSCFVGTQVP